MRLLLACLLPLVLAPTSSHAKIFDIAVRGSPAPGVEGNFNYPGPAFLTDDGHVVFTSSTNPSYQTCIFRFAFDGSDGTAVLCPGQPVGLPGTDVWVDFTYPAVNASGLLAFAGSYLDTNGLQQRGLFRWSNGAAELVVLEGDVIDGRAVLNISRVAINDGGDVIFWAAGLFEATAGGDLSMVVPTSSLPDGTLFGGPYYIALASNGDIAFSGWDATPVDDPTIVYLLSSGVLTRLATAGTPAAPGIPGTVTDVGHFEFTPGGVLFAEFSFTGSPVTAAVLRWNGTEWEQAVTSDPAATATYLMSVGGVDDLAWEELVGSTWTAYLRHEGLIRTLAATGDPAPGSGGGAFEIFLRPYALPLGRVDPRGRLVAGASLSGGSGDRGIFTFGTTRVPSLSRWAGLVVVLGIVGSTVRLLRRTRRRHGFPRPS